MSGAAHLAWTPAPEERGCPDESALVDLARGETEGAHEMLLAHLDVCPACRHIVAQLAKESGGASQEAREPEPGAQVGRFLLLEELGRGGMGTVYAAFDPTLDRKVALKLLRPLEGGAAQSLSVRLLTEAQALARLAHPNVVTLFEAQPHGDAIYLAMELIAGPSLRELSETRPGRAALLARFVEAGRGLAAAHEAGLVHRDFKPDNVLLASDGRACVTDFGLADRGGALQVAGTPGYLAPELWRGERADARSDQFSFCVSLWECLAGERPFAAERGAALLEEVARGPSRPLRGVPARLRRALERGLRSDPRERHPSLRALLAELEAAAEPALSLASARLVLLSLALFAGGAGSHALWSAASADPLSASHFAPPPAQAAAQALAPAPAFLRASARAPGDACEVVPRATPLAQLDPRAWHAAAASASQPARRTLALAPARARPRPERPAATLAQESRAGRPDAGSPGTGGGAIDRLEGSALSPGGDASLGTRTVR